jgi:hypothetical protein
MRHTPALIASVIAAAILAGCSDDDPTGPEPTAQEFDWSGGVAPGGRIEIKNISGDVRASFTSGSEVEVHAIKTSQDSDLNSVTIEVVQHAGGVTICAVYPDVPGRAPNECRPGLDGNMSSRDNDVSVDFTLRVPAGVQFVGRVMSGDVLAEDLRSDAFASTVNGKVSLTTTGVAEASSTYGSVSAAIGRADPGRDLAFRTIYGDVTVRIPADTNADVLVSSNTGRINSDFPLEGTSTHRFGTLGSGGPNLWLSTVDGRIDLQKGAAAQH